MFKLTKIQRETIANTLRLGAKFKSVDDADVPNGLLMYWPNTSLEDVLNIHGLAPIIDAFALMFNGYKRHIEEHLYQYTKHSDDYFYTEDYTKNIIDLCAMLGVDVTPKHHKINTSTEVGLYPIELFKDFIKLIINYKDLPLCYPDTLDEGGYIFVEQFEHLNINWRAYDVNDTDDVDYNTLKNMVYYGGCLCSNTGILK